MSVAESLFRLQQRDQRIDALRRRQRDIQAAMVEPPAVTEPRAKAAAAQQALDQVQVTLRDAELERLALTAKITSEEQRLYSGRISNVKELTSLENEINSLKRRLGKLDDTMLETMFAVEEAQKTQQATADRRAQIDRKWSTHLAGLREQLEAVQTELAELIEEAATMRQALNPADLAVYDELRQKKGGRAVAPINHGRCDGCQVALPHVDIARARQAPLAFCSHCGRILLA